MATTMGPLTPQGWIGMLFGVPLRVPGAGLRSIPLPAPWKAVRLWLSGEAAAFFFSVPPTCVVDGLSLTRGREGGNIPLRSITEYSGIRNSGVSRPFRTILNTVQRWEGPRDGLPASRSAHAS